MNLRLNLLQKMILFTLRDQPWTTPQELAEKLDITPKQAGSLLKNLQMGGATEMQQEKQLIGDGKQRRTKIIRHYALTEAGRELSTEVTSEEVTHFNATQSKKEKPVSTKTSKEDATTHGPERQRNKRGIIILTADEVFANVEEKFAPGEWFTTKSVKGTYPVMYELVAQGRLDEGKPTSAAIPTFRRPKED